MEKFIEENQQLLDLIKLISQSDDDVQIYITADLCEDEDEGEDEDCVLEDMVLAGVMASEAEAAIMEEKVLRGIDTLVLNILSLGTRITGSDLGTLAALTNLKRAYS